MSRYNALPLRTRLVGFISQQMDYLPHAPEFVLKSIQQVRIHPWVERVLFGQSLPMARVQQQTVPTVQGGVDVRLYYPQTNADLPVIVFFHAGGWVIGNLETHDVLCRRLANDNQALVVSVDYHLAPWVKFPVPVEQGEAVIRWIIREAKTLQADTSRMVVMGDSAGGNLSAVLARKFRDQLVAQVLVYPVTDGQLATQSAEENHNAPILSRSLMQFFMDCYARHDSDKHDADFSPLQATDLAGLPPALVITAEYDVLRDDGFAYAERLRAAGVEVDHEHYADIHGFMSLPTLCKHSEQAFQAVEKFLATRLAEA